MKMKEIIIYHLCENYAKLIARIHFGRLTRLMKEIIIYHLCEK